MRGISLKYWEEFEEAALRMISETREPGVSHPLFRGVSDSGYRLETSLERLGQTTSLSEYDLTIKVAHNYVETCTGKRWDLTTKVSFGEFELPACEFMAYLRQNSFPSPLLDWTKSPYIAAFFAFRNIYRKARKDEYVAIFAYRECVGGGKSWTAREPHIHTLGPSIATCRTHYLQQSEYSICVRAEEGEMYFASHEDIQPEEGQDILVKWNIPMSEQTKVLTKLSLMNITPFSLFESEPSLMDTLAIRQLVI